MKQTNKLLASATAFLVFNAASAHAALLLSVDFGPSTLEAGFQAQSAGSVVHSTIEGDITVVSDGSFFNRGTGGSNVDLFRDFTFKNNTNPLNLTLSGPGIQANTAYDFKFWSYDSNSGSKTHSQAYAGVAGTTGSAGPIVYPAGAPADLDSFSATGTFISDGSGLISIALTDTITAGNVAQPEPRLNGFQISSVPEPSTALLGSFGALALLIRRRK